MIPLRKMKGGLILLTTWVIRGYRRCGLLVFWCPFVMENGRYGQFVAMTLIVLCYGWLLKAVMLL